jgi:hypothetical protein
MGYFANLYVIDASATDEGVTTTTTTYGADVKPHFSWGIGERPPGFFSYADGTVVSDTDMTVLPGYPRIERCSPKWGTDRDRCLIEGSFQPRQHDDPVIFHLMLPGGFVPRPDMKPFKQPSTPFVFRFNDRVVATYPVVGPAEVRFWITRLQDDMSLDDYDSERLFHPDQSKPLKAEVEFNVGILKLKLS